MMWRYSRSGWGLALLLTLVSLPCLLLLFVLRWSSVRVPESSLRLISREGTVIYFNTATVQNVDVLFSGVQPGWQERIRVADYLMRPVLYRLPLQSRLLHAAISRLAAGLLDGVLRPYEIRDLHLLLTEGSSDPVVSGRAPAQSLERMGLKGDVYSTISDSIQQGTEAIIRSELQVLRAKGAYQAAVVVLERGADHLQLRAMVDTGARHGLNGALLVRQAGSVLKPFLYAMAFDRFSVRPGDPVDDTPLRLVEGSEVYAPRNHDNRFAGRITVREALAASRNIPAVRMLQLVGIQEYAAFLRQAGLEHIGDAKQYGLSMALGTAGASPLETAILFSIPASAGQLLPLYIGSDGQPIYLTPAGRPVRNPPPQRRFFSKEASLLLTHVLSDREARRISFGARNFLDFPFDVAAKTGTSQSFRDSWTAGYTTRYVVAVWVGNFSGQSMNAVSGLRGAARIFHQVIRMLSAGQRPTFRYPDDWQTLSVCGQCNPVEELVLPHRAEPDDVVRSILLDSSGDIMPSPLQGQVFYLDPESDGVGIPLELRVAGRLTLLKEGRIMAGFDQREVAAGRLLVSLSPGHYEIRLVSPEGHVLRHFEVR